MFEHYLATELFNKFYQENCQKVELWCNVKFVSVHTTTRHLHPAKLDPNFVFSEHQTRRQVKSAGWGVWRGGQPDLTGSVFTESTEEVSTASALWVVGLLTNSSAPPSVLDLYFIQLWRYFAHSKDFFYQNKTYRSLGASVGR